MILGAEGGHYLVGVIVYIYNIYNIIITIFIYLLLYYYYIYYLLYYYLN